MTVQGAVMPQAPAAAEDGKARTAASDQQRRYAHCLEQPEREAGLHFMQGMHKCKLRNRELSAVSLPTVHAMSPECPPAWLSRG